MPAHTCWDPLEVPCGWGRPPGFQLIFLEEGELLPAEVLTPPCLVSVSQSVTPPHLPQDIALEIRCTDPLTFAPPPLDQPFSVYLSYVRAFENDDIAVVEQVLLQAASAGCRAVVAPGLRGEAQYRHRWFSLVRLLCDRLKLKFSICEPGELPASERLNSYLASQRGCCRHPAYDPRRSV